MSQFSVKATFDGKELVQGFKDVKKEVQGLESAGEDAKKSLDQMLQQKNSTTNYKRQLSQITAELNDLAVNYARLSDAEKQSDFGQAMAQRIDELTAKAQELKGVFDGVNQTLKGDIQLPEPDVKVWDGMAELIEAAASGFQTYAGVLGMSEESTEALTKTIAKMATIQAGANTVVKIGKMLQKDSNLIMAVTKVQTMAATAAIRLKTAAEVKGKTATVAATVAQKALNAAANANPYVLLASAIVAVGAAIYKFAKNSNEAEEAQEEYNKKVKEAEEREKSRRETVNKSVGDIIGKYKLLQTEWKNLTSIQEKNKWITDNKDKFDELGLSINNITSAQDAFINKSDLVIRSLTAQAEAAALAAVYQEAYADAYTRNRELDASLETVKYKSGYNPTNAEEREAGLTPSDFQTYTYTQTSTYGTTGTTVTTLTPKVNESGARKLEEMRKKRIEDEKKANDAEVESILEDLLAKKISAQEAQAELGKLAKKTPTISSTTSSTTSAIIPEVFDEKSLKYAQQKVSELQDTLSKMATDSPDFAPTLAQLHEWQDVVASIQDMMKKPEIKEPEIKIEKVVEEEVEAAKEEIVTLEDAINSAFDSFNAVANVVSGVNSIYEAFKSLPEALAEAENGWERFMAGFNAAMSVMSLLANTMGTINTLMTTFNTIQEISTALKLKDAAATATKVSADTASAASAGAEAAANTAAATAGAAKAVSWLPIVGPILAVAAIAAVIGGIMAARSKGKYAAGGIIPGSSKIGDFNIARVNGGEMILNTRQQANLFSMLDKNRLPQSSVSSGEVTFRIQGDTLVGVIDNYNKKRSRI